MSNFPADQLVWINCEMTGLDVDRDGLCEIGVIVTDFNLKPLDAGLELVINPGPEPLAQMGDFVREMHVASGLLPRIEAGLTLSEAEQQVMAYIRRFVPSGKRPIVAGNTIGMDRRFLSKYMPALDEQLHYRSIDVSTIKELARQWYPAAFFSTPEKRGGHRALADIAESIQELAYLRNTVLVAGPGPDKAASNTVAKEVAGVYSPLIDAAIATPRE